MAYINHSINSSPTIRGEASAAMEQPGLKAVKFEAGGKLALGAAGDLCIGIALATTDGLQSGDEFDVQIKDIGYWTAGAAVKKGQLLACGDGGKAVPAGAGDKALAIALEDGAAGRAVQALICRVTA